MALATMRREARDGAYSRDLVDGFAALLTDCLGRAPARRQTCDRPATT